MSGRGRGWAGPNGHMGRGQRREGAVVAVLDGEGRGGDRLGVLAEAVAPMVM